MLIGRIGRKSRIRQDRAESDKIWQNRAGESQAGDITGLQKKQTLQRNVCFSMYIKDD